MVGSFLVVGLTLDVPQSALAKTAVFNRRLATNGNRQPRRNPAREAGFLQPVDRL
jgi:hypothetical protein